MLILGSFTSTNDQNDYRKKKCENKELLLSSYENTNINIPLVQKRIHIDIILLNTHTNKHTYYLPVISSTITKDHH